MLTAEVAEGRIGSEVGRPDVGGAAGGIVLAGQKLAHGGGAGGAQGAHAQDGVGLVLAAHERAELHGGGGVDDDDGLVAVGLGCRDDALLLHGELQLVLALHVVGGLVVGGEVLGDAGVQVAQQVARQVAALAAATADDHERGGAGDGGLRLAAIRGEGNLADVVGSGGRVVHRDLGLGIVGIVVVDPAEGGLVDIEAGGGNAVVHVHAGVGVNGAGASAAIDGVRGVAAQQGDLGASGQRQRTVVFEQDGALAQDLIDDLVGGSGCLGAAAVLGIVVGGIPVLGTLDVLDGGRTAAQVVVKQRAEHVGAHVGRRGDAEKAGGDGRVANERTPGDGLLCLCHFWVSFLSPKEEGPLAAAGGWTVGGPSKGSTLGGSVRSAECVSASLVRP